MNGWMGGWMNGDTKYANEESYPFKVAKPLWGGLFSIHSQKFDKNLQDVFSKQIFLNPD